MWEILRSWTGVPKLLFRAQFALLSYESSKQHYMFGNLQINKVLLNIYSLHNNCAQ